MKININKKITVRARPSKLTDKQAPSITEVVILSNAMPALISGDSFASHCSSQQLDNSSSDVLNPAYD